MAFDSYSIGMVSVQNLLSWIDQGQVAIPELQRPFVWKTTKVRDLIDSLYKGYPIGFLITYQSPNVSLKNTTEVSGGKQIIIDGQQRITAITAAISGKPIIDRNYKQQTITIAFNPIEERFETLTPAIMRDPRWINDISTVLAPDFNAYQFVEDFTSRLADTDKGIISANIQKLHEILTRQIGNLVINADVPIDTVTEIFVRINSKGTPLSEADFAMSQLSIFEFTQGSQDGMKLRKAIDAYSDLRKNPKATIDPSIDDEYLRQIGWAENNSDKFIYRPSYTDIIRVLGLVGLRRARIRDVVALLEGRNFAASSFHAQDSYQQEIAEESVRKFQSAFNEVTHENLVTKFEQDILRGSGFNDSKMFHSQNLLNYTFATYVLLCRDSNDTQRVNSITRRLMVHSLLTGRHVGSFETNWDEDFRSITGIESAERLCSTFTQTRLSDVFWSTTLPQELDKVGNRSTPLLNLFLAAQKKLGSHSFLSDIPVSELMLDDLHHIFPKNYLKNNSVPQNDTNVIANYIYFNKATNIQVGDKPPIEYLTDYRDHWNLLPQTFEQNLAQNAIPADENLWKLENYNEFKAKRRELIAQFIREYFQTL